MLKYIDHFISPSRFTKKKHHELGLDIPILHIPYFLPKKEIPDGLSPKENQSTTDQPYFLFVGRLEKIKGVQNLIPIFQQRPQYTLLIAGTGEYESSLRQLVGSTPNIRFLGRLDHSQLVDLYRSATAVIVPSICYEVFGIIIIESFATRTPVIVNNLGALPEVVQDSGGGFIYNNSEELLGRMDALVNTPNLRDELGAKGHEAYLKFWTEDYHLDVYFDLIHSLQTHKPVVA
jgi:glycosyltransferase involved in cell wall biosynthesis